MENLFEQAQGLHQRRRLEEAIGLYASVIEATPNRAEVYYKRGNALNDLGRLEAALQDYDRAISLNPSYAYALCNRGSVLERLERWDEALASYDSALALDPKDSMAHYNRGAVLKNLERLEEALASYDAAIALNANYAEAYVNRGNVLQQLRLHEVAIESFGRAIELKPRSPKLFKAGGSPAMLSSVLGKAWQDYNKAISLKPDFAEAFRYRGHLLVDVDRHEEAAKDYLKVTELQPDAAGYQSLARALVRLKRFDHAIASLDKAMALDPATHYLIGASRAAKMHACHWDGLGVDLDQIAKDISEGKRVCNPLSFDIVADPALQRSVSEIWVQDKVLDSCEEDLRRIGDIAPQARSPQLTQDPGRIFLRRFSNPSSGLPHGRHVRAPRPIEVRGNGVRIRARGQ